MGTTKHFLLAGMDHHVILSLAAESAGHLVINSIFSSRQVGACSRIHPLAFLSVHPVLFFFLFLLDPALLLIFSVLLASVIILLEFCMGLTA